METLKTPYFCHGSFGEQLVPRSLEGFSMKQIVQPVQAKPATAMSLLSCLQFYMEALLMLLIYAIG